MSCIYIRIIAYYSIYKENRTKRQHFNNQINKYHLNLSQFFSLHLCTSKTPTKSADLSDKCNSYHALKKCEGVKRMLNEDEDIDEKESGDTYDSESTFNKLEHVSKLGIKVNNENLWPTIKYITVKNRRTVIPAT